ncbi:unnamed protein product, partial [Rotaria socialis]
MVELLAQQQYRRAIGSITSVSINIYNELQNHINVKSNSLRRLSSEINISSGTAKLFPLAMIQQKSNPYVRDDTIFIKIMVHVGDMSKAPIHIQQLLIKKE